MKLKVKGEWVKSLSKVWKSEAGYHHDETWRDWDIDDFSEADLTALIAIAEKNIEVKGSRAIIDKIKTYRGLHSDVKSQKIKRLEAIEDAMKVLLLQHTENRWLFTENEDGHLVPWYVFKIEFEEGDSSRQSPAHTSVELAAVRRGQTIATRINFGSDDRKGTMLEMLESKGYFLESEAVLKRYAEEMAYYNQVCTQTGEQFNAYGTAYDLSDRYRDVDSMERDGDPTKVVMDNVNNEGSSERYGTRDRVTGQFWAKEKNTEGESDEEVIVRLPHQPYVKVFDLTAHRFLLIHACDLKAYPWDATLLEKLVLPKDHKELVQMLVTGADLVMEDIIKGKTGGVIVISTGDPGTGKTLTAEVFSEGVKKPLYKVHCSQLGTDEEKLEENLQIVLARAERWKSIMLIDEADVYVYQRGVNIRQNAIVGVFLRVLEYYRGILFMTSNRGTIIDDAIMARATAWIQYDLPDLQKLTRIWRVLSDQFKIKLTDEDIATLVKLPEFAHTSGRSVKNLLKLARLVSGHREKPITPEIIQYVSQFLPIEQKEAGTTSKQ
jgi:ATPase family associated with various cellular activities (AAA)